jgi:cytochrome d ubiquinol oxidase subunit I
MFDADPVVLARLQFAANMTFHILFPSISIALGWFLLFFKLRHVATADPKWGEAYGFWVKVFALTFALGVVSGVTMSFQFGTNWPGYMQRVGNIAGPLLAYEVLTAFFLEATFLAVMLFGKRRVSERMHTLATFLVAFGTTLSAFWILALNSWMQTPAGYAMVGGQAHATDWLAIIFNPSFPYRLTHMLLASGLTASFLIAGVSAYRLLRGDAAGAPRATLKAAVYVAACLIPLQIIAGDQHGLNTLHHQPAKLAAMEGLWETTKGAPAVLFALPDAATHSNRFEIAIPKLASIYLTHSLDGEVKGVTAFGDLHPPVAPLFWAFRVMVGIGMLMLAVSWAAAWTIRRSRDDALPPRLLLRVLTAMSFSGWVALLAGWYVTEVGRQLYLVSGVLLTADAASDTPAALIGASLAMYLLLYVALLAAYVSVVFYLARQAGHPTPPAATPASGAPNMHRAAA